MSWITKANRGAAQPTAPAPAVKKHIAEQHELDFTPKPRAIDLSTSTPRDLPLLDMEVVQKNDYDQVRDYIKGLFPAPKPQPFDFQLPALPRAAALLGEQKKNAILIAPTGSGKTYMYGYIIGLLRRDFSDRFSPERVVLVVTKPSIITQTNRVLKNEFGLRNIWVFSYEQLRSSLGELIISWEDKVLENGDVVSWPIWSDYAKELFSLVIWDECQSLKNEGSLQTRLAFSQATSGIPALLGSATPYSRPVHTRATVALIKPPYGPGSSVLVDNRMFPSWISDMCGNKSPLQWSPASMRRIQEAIEPFTIRPDKVKYKHKTFIKQLLVRFSTALEAELYANAFKDYQEALLKAGKEPHTGFVAVLVAQQKFCQKSELIRSPHMASMAHELEKGGKNVIIACRYGDTLRVIHQRLVEQHGYDPNKISVIMGGQSSTERQRNIDAFQSDENHIMLLMFQAGGAGLSLHQYKPVNKRPRYAVLPPVWNAEEMVQVLGRAHRCNSDSTTHQIIVWYAETIEEQVSHKLKSKMSSLKEVVKTRESWNDFYAQAATGGKVSLRDFGKQEAAEPMRDASITDDDDEESVDESLVESTTIE